jgi:hypothetical protein
MNFYFVVKSKLMSIFLPPELRIYISSLLLLMILVYMLQIEVRNVGHNALSNDQLFSYLCWIEDLP